MTIGAIWAKILVGWIGLYQFNQLQNQTEVQLGDDVIVHSSDDDSATEEVAEAIEQVAEQQQSFELGQMVGRMEALEEKVNYHDALIQLHNHDGLATQDDTAALVMDAENRMVGQLQSVVDKAEDVIEETNSIEGEPETEESNGEDDNGETEEDEPPKSRANRKPWAHRYYESSKL